MAPVGSAVLVYLVTLAGFVALDAAWLILAGAPLFRSHIGAILRPEPMFGAAIAFYLIYAGGLTALAVRPALEARSPREAAWKGAVLGLTAYATFDLTNLAVIAGWTAGLAVIDIGWGVLATTLAALAGYGAGVRVSGAVRTGGGLSP